MEILLSLSIAMLGGLLLSRVAKLLKMPAVTAYLVAGIVVGPYCLGAFGIDGLGFVSMSNKSFSIICDVALGFIAFSMGNEFRLSHLRKTGKQATVIGIFQAVVTTLIVDATLIALHFSMPDKLSLPTAIILGAIASATAPAATLMVVRQYKAKGELTDVLLPVVALDDAVGLMLFAVSFGVAKALISGKIDVLSVILEPVLEVVLSLGLGAVIGYVFTYFEKFFHSNSKRLAMAVTFIFLTVGLSMMKFELFGIHIAFSSLLVCMMLGTVFCNICDFSHEFMERVDRWTAPLYILFFVLSGAELELSVFGDIAIVLIGLTYIVSRCIGKYFGAYASAKSVKSSPNIVKYLGITLWPQAGVALGMALKATALDDVGTVVSNITLFSVLIYELVGPSFTKWALTKSGDIKPDGAKSSRGSVHNEPLPEKVKKA